MSNLEDISEKYFPKNEKQQLEMYVQKDIDLISKEKNYGLYNSTLSSNFEKLTKKLSSYLNKYNNNLTKEEYFQIKEKIGESSPFYLEDIIKNYNNIVNKNFQKAQYSPIGLSLTLQDNVTITADNLGEFALPIVEYIRKTKPDYIVASDRGARLLGLAVFRLYGKLHGRLPTIDGTIRFRRFSKSNTQKETEEHLRPLVNEMLKHKRNPKVLVLDDWVDSGGTKQLTKDVFDKLGDKKIDVKFGVMVGGGADISGHGSKTSGFAGVADWHDNSNIIGIQYFGIKPEPVRSQQAKDYRGRIYAGINELVRELAEKAA